MKVSNNTGAKISGLDLKQSKSLDKSKVRDGSSIDKRNIDGSAKIDLSERAQMMSKAKNIASESSVDEAKINRLQALIDKGEYNVDAAAVADRLVDEHLLFPGE